VPWQSNLHRQPWNKGIIVGQKAPLKLKEFCAIRKRLQLAHRTRELASFNLEEVRVSSDALVLVVQFRLIIK